FHPQLTLSLLVLWIRTDHHNSAMSPDDPAFFTHLLDRRSHLHLKNLLHKGDVPCPYLRRRIILPRVKSYGLSSTSTLSPGRILMKLILILPEICASTWCPPSTSTRNMALGSGSVTTPSTSMLSCFGMQFPLA